MATATPQRSRGAERIPSWAVPYLSHLDKHEALGIRPAEAHGRWVAAGHDKKLAERGAEYVKGHRRVKGEAPPAGRSADVEKSLHQLREEHHYRTGKLVDLEALAKAYDRGTAAYDATTRPTATSRHGFGRQRAKAYAILATEGRRIVDGYTGDDDLLPYDHPIGKARIDKALKKHLASLPPFMPQPPAPAWTRPLVLRKSASGRWWVATLEPAPQPRPAPVGKVAIRKAEPLATVSKADLIRGRFSIT